MANELAKVERMGPPLRLEDGSLTPAYEQLLVNLRDGYPPSLAIQKAGVKRSTAYHHRVSDDAFRDAWDDAYEHGTDAVYVAEAARRAVQGVVKPVFYKGKPITDANGKMIEVREYSDRLLEFILTARRPREFGRKIEMTGANGEPIKIILSPAEMEL